MHQLLHWVLPSLNLKDRYHDHFFCSVALELLKAEGVKYFDIEFSLFNSVTFAKVPEHLLKKALDFHLI